MTEQEFDELEIADVVEAEDWEGRSITGIVLDKRTKSAFVYGDRTLGWYLAGRITLKEAGPVREAKKRDLEAVRVLLLRVQTDIADIKAMLE